MEGFACVCPRPRVCVCVVCVVCGVFVLTAMREVRVLMRAACRVPRAAVSKVKRLTVNILGVRTTFTVIAKTATDKQRNRKSCHQQESDRSHDTQSLPVV